ncbi:uncharacterized protein LOC124358179 [Homalodisca vitripennis]|uniref:uncharacterized protein LOC124358179 n=1 Tax=Homalodisca vitripennis TaxID=197043 RepID=UPI001EEBB813|nr:uncharacterized protein LOC124358179 [Homalodisca vitripennis]
MQVIAKEVILFGQIFGGLPLKYKNDSSGGKEITFSFTVCVWGWVVIVLQTCLSQITLYIDYHGRQYGDPIRMTSYTAIFAVMLDIISLNIMALVVFMMSFRHYKKFIEICYLLGKVDLYFGQKCESGEKPKVFAIVAYMITLCVTNVVQESFLESEGRNTFVYYIPVLTLYFVAASLFIQFTTVTQNIVTRFRLVNETIKKAVINKSFGQLSKNHDLANIVAIQDNTSCVTKLRELMDLYWLLCDAVKHANVFYGNQLLAAVFSAFVHIIINLYYLFLHLRPGQASFLVMQGVWAITHVSHLVLLVRPSTDVTDAANETAPMVCRLLNRDLSKNIRKQIASSVTTYLVILIQFQSNPASVTLFDRVNRITQ